MAIEWVTREEAERVGTREEQVLIEQSPDHYPEFGRFLHGKLESAGGSLFFRGVSGMVYRVGAVAERPNGLGGVEICVRLGGGGAQGVSGETIDGDLWAFLEWLIGEVDGEWSREALRKVGAIYRVPGAPERA